MMKSCIYQILNIQNGKFYIGHSQDYDVRWWEHERKLKIGTHDNEYLQRAWNKYGEIAFEFIIIEIVNLNDMLTREQFWIDTLDACNKNIGYNINSDATRPPSAKGKTHSAETRLKISNSNLGKPKSNTDKMKKPKTAEHKEALSLARRDFAKWPCEDGYYCKCSDCRYKRNRLKNYLNIRLIKC